MKFKGKVIKGLGRGRKLGFATANLNLPDKNLAKLPEGVYAAFAKVGKRKFPSLVFWGQARMFREKTRKFEVHLFDFDKNIYDREIEVKIVKKLRANKKFASSKDLILQMKRDLIRARKCLRAL